MRASDALIDLTLPERIAARAVSYLNTPYWFGARQPGTCLDCAGVIVCALRAEGVECGDPSYRTDGTEDTLPQIKEALKALRHLPKTTHRRTGDVLVFRVPPGRLARYGVCHLGVCESPDVIVHAADGREGRVIRTPLDYSIVNRIEGVWRVKENS